MAEGEYKLTQDQRNQIAEFLTGRGANRPCPACGTNHWTVGEHVIRGELFTPEGVFLGGPSYPWVFVVCDNCFFVRPHLAIPLGIVEQTKEPVTEKADG